MLISLTVGKVDAGVAVLLTEDKRLIEFPSILLPPSITSGSIVDITVARNPTLETHNTHAFSNLQTQILQTYGLHSPTSPTLTCRNATQTSIVLAWPPLALATATLRSLSLYRNGAKAGSIPRYNKDGEEVLATKISGLAVDTEYTFHLVLRTSAGTYTSPKLSVRTQKMTDLTGITVTPGPLPPPLKASLVSAVERIGAKIVEGVRIDTTHFVCTEGRGREWERAVEMNIPVVRPEWVEGCEREGRIVGVRGYYLGADPKMRVVGSSSAGMGQQQQQQQQQQQSARPGVGARGESQRAGSGSAEPQTPVTPFPGGDSRGQEEVEGAKKVEPSPPLPPAKDTPAVEAVSPQSESDVGRVEAKSEEGEASGTVSPEEEEVKDEEKSEVDGGGVGESMDNMSEVAL